MTRYLHDTMQKLQHSIRSSLACKKKDNVYYAVIGANKQRAHMFFREVQMQLLYNGLLLHEEAKTHLKKLGTLSPECPCLTC